MDLLLWWLLGRDRFAPGKGSPRGTGRTSVLGTDLRISVVSTDGLAGLV